MREDSEEADSYNTRGLCERLLGSRPVRSGKEHLERDHRI